MHYRDIIDYWFDEKSKKYWFTSTPEIDNDIKQRFERYWQRASKGEFDEWQDTPEGALALIIILDQFPLNMYRGQVKSFHTEKMAVKVSLKAIASNFDKGLDEEKLLFLFMPLMHSENIDHQNLQVELFKRNNFNLEYSLHHKNLVERFGRFPHRNEILGRESTSEEKEYLLSDQAFKG